MKRQPSVAITVVGVVMAITALLGNARQWLQRLELRSAVESARLDVAEFTRLQTEHQRLREKQISLAEFAALRADHEALPRLRAELDALTKP
jgi:hypothetical protein